MELRGRWLPDGMRVEPADDGRVRLRGGEHDNQEFESISALLEWVRLDYPDLGLPGRD